MIEGEEIEKAKAELNQFTKKHNVQGYLVSAKTGQNIYKAFEKLTRQCVKAFGTSTKDSSQAQTVIDDIRKKKQQF